MTAGAPIAGLLVEPSERGMKPAFSPLAASPRFAGGLRGGHLFRTYLRLIPILWLFGVLTPAAALMLVKLAAERWPRGVLINFVILSWFSIGLSQAAASILNGVAKGDLGLGIANAIGFGVVGWIFAGLAIAAGAACRLSDAQTIRAMTWVGGYILILAGIAAVARLAGRHELYLWPTPAALLLPSSPSVAFYTAALVFQTEQTLGEATTRLVLFFPWAPALGLGGIAIAFISALDRNLWWRLIGFAGGAVGVVFSWSRIAIILLVVIGALLAFLRLPPLWRFALLGAGLVGLFAMLLYSFDPFQWLDEIQDRVNGARAGSSMARELIYEKSWEGFLESPIIGQGWIGESVHRKEVLPIGSHSTIYGLLYTGGLPTFSAFVIAMGLTFVALVWRYASARSADPHHLCVLVGIGLMLCLAPYSRYEALFNLTLPCVFLFTWIGACIGGRDIDAGDLDAARARRGFDIVPPELGVRDIGSVARSLNLPVPPSLQAARAFGPHSAGHRTSAFHDL